MIGLLYYCIIHIQYNWQSPYITEIQFFYTNWLLKLGLGDSLWNSYIRWWLNKEIAIKWINLFYNSYIFKINVIEEWLFIVINFWDHFWSFIEKILPSKDLITFGIHTIRPCMSIPGTFRTATNYNYILIYFKYVNNTNIIHK